MYFTTVHGEEVWREEDQTLPFYTLPGPLHIHQNKVITNENLENITMERPGCRHPFHDFRAKNLCFTRLLNPNTPSVNLYSGALFFKLSLNWSLYSSVLLILLLTTVCTITAGLTGQYDLYFSIGTLLFVI